MEWFKNFEKVISKTMNVDVPFQIFGHTHKVKPNFVSITKRDQLAGVATIRNGYVTTYDDMNTDGCRVQVLIGDEERGNGGTYMAEEDIPKTPQGVSDSIIRSMDSCLKGAMSGYVELARKAMHVKDLKFYNLAPAPIVKHLEDVSNGVSAVLPTEQEMKSFEEMSKQIIGIKHIQESAITLETILTKNWFINSEGTAIRTRQLNGRAINSIDIRNKEGYLQTINFSQLYTEKGGWSNALAMKNDFQQIIQEVEELYNAPRILSGQYPIIMDGSLFGTFFHEAIAAHLLSGMYISNGIANTFEGKIGKRVMPEFLSIRDEPNMEGGYGSFSYDDEGVRAKDVTLVENGILQNYLLDRASAQKLNMSSNGRSRSQWVIQATENGAAPLIPEPRVSNLIIEATTAYQEQQLITMMQAFCEENDIPFGIYASGIAGEVSLENGSFQLEPDKIIAIYPDGRTQRMVGGIINGNPFTALESIFACSNQYKPSYGMCGSLSGWVPTQEIAPSAFIPSIEVSSYKAQKATDKLI